jgi:hypothetical protein
MSLTEAGLIEVEESEDEIGDIKISYHRSDINSQTTDAGVIPIQSMGVVNVDGNDISSTEIMAHALTNSTMEQNYSIRRGSAFVNEYARTDAVTGLRNDGGPSNPFNPPTLWITINPADTQDPIAQVFARVEIDLDNFCKTAGPNNTQRATNVAEDPFSSAKYFHFIVKCILEILFGITKNSGGQIDWKEGIFGKIQSYIGMVEAQGRGILHLHMLLWLKNAPSAMEMKMALKSEMFQAKVVAFIKASIRTSIGDISHEEVAALPKSLEFHT